MAISKEQRQSSLDDFDFKRFDRFISRLKKECKLLKTTFNRDSVRYDLEIYREMNCIDIKIDEIINIWEKISGKSFD